MTIRVPAVPTRPVVEPTSLLTHVAREFAPVVARLWPAPHTAFITAPAARRHLVCLGVALGREVADVRETLLVDRLRRAIGAVVRDAPAGLERALGRMGDIAWAAGAYRTLLKLLAEPKASKVLRHAEHIDPGIVERLDLLPAAMAEAVDVVMSLTPAGVMALREAYGALLFRDGRGTADAAAARWAKTRSAKTLFEAVRWDMAPEPMTPPRPGTARLRPIRSKAELSETARRYRNCLADRSPYAATGWSAYYEWLGSPGAVVEISRDHVFGWRLDEARLAHNASVPEAVRGAIVDELALMGVHVGRSGWELHRALNVDVGAGFPLRPVEEAIAAAFVAD